MQFEHRDLHWGNLLIRRVPVGRRARFTLRCAPLMLEQPLLLSYLIVVVNASLGGHWNSCTVLLVVLWSSHEHAMRCMLRDVESIL